MIYNESISTWGHIKFEYENVEFNCVPSGDLTAYVKVSSTIIEHPEMTVQVPRERVFTSILHAMDLAKTLHTEIKKIVPGTYSKVNTLAGTYEIENIGRATRGGDDMYYAHSNSLAISEAKSDQIVVEIIADLLMNLSCGSDDDFQYDHIELCAGDHYWHVNVVWDMVDGTDAYNCILSGGEDRRRRGYGIPVSSRVAFHIEVASFYALQMWAAIVAGMTFTKTTKVEERISVIGWNEFRVYINLPDEQTTMVYEDLPDTMLATGLSCSKWLHWNSLFPFVTTDRVNLKDTAKLHEYV